MGEAAQICGCAVGTVKSRVNRARKWLAELLHLDIPSLDHVEGGAIEGPLAKKAGIVVEQNP